MTKTKPSVIRLTRDTPKRKAAVRSARTARGRTEEPSPDDSTEPGIPRLFHRTVQAVDIHSDTDSGVTNVLEALGRTEDRLERDSSRDEAGDDDESESEDSDSHYTTIPALPALKHQVEWESEDSDSHYATIPAIPAVTHQRPRRIRRPPDRYVP